jgi:ribosomal protein S18 acetylase RimI-like enzyme
MMSQTLVCVRLATPNDKQRAWAIVDEYSNSINVVRRDDGAHFEQYLAPPHAFWLAEVGGRVAGCVALRALPELDGRACEMKRLYVRPPYRRNGLARALMDALESYAKEAGNEFVYLDTIASLVEAVRFYERRGYEHIERYNDNPQAEVYMRKRLHP